jgi:hypothetical protein
MYINVSHRPGRGPVSGPRHIKKKKNLPGPSLTRKGCEPLMYIVPNLRDTHGPGVLSVPRTHETMGSLHPTEVIVNVRSYVQLRVL